VATPKTRPVKIFLAEHSATSDVYSNGLEIRNLFRTVSTPRSYQTYSSATLEPKGRREAVTGLVFHTTESLLLPLEPERARSLNQTRDSLLEFVRNNRLYNFVIDRFGQVFRIVPEDQVALHAGHSIWGNGTDLWINLNESFVGIAFETRTGEEATAPQIHAGRLLTAMLRSIYDVPEANCVTHAQVSINPENMRIGYHTDWAAHFPFAEVGLSGGYRMPVAAVQRFGFSYDEAFLTAIGGHPWEGLTAAENQIILDAAARGVTAARYRQQLQQDYKAIRRLHFERINHEQS
jgi:N-acetylmuramoyl-L-alanine amidase